MTTILGNAKSNKSLEDLFSRLNKIGDFIKNINQYKTSYEEYHREIFMLENFYMDTYLKLNLSIKYSKAHNFDFELIELQDKINAAILDIDNILNMFNYTENIDIIIDVNQLPTYINNISTVVNNIYNNYNTNFIFYISNQLSSHTTQIEKFGEVNPLIDKLKELDTKLTEKIVLANSTIVDLKSAYSADALANSFKTRSEELSKLSKKWIIFLGVSIAIIILLTLCHLPTIDLNNTDIYKVQLILWSYLIYSPLALLSFWLIWFFSKNYFYTSKLRDEYKFKSDLSLAFNGYKKEIQEVDTNQTTNLLPQLLSGLITNICENPVKEKKEEHNSPVTEILNQATKAAQTLKDSK